MSQEVEDHKELWESEIKSKSKLGLRVSPSFGFGDDFKYWINDGVCICVQSCVCFYIHGIYLKHTEVLTEVI